MASARTDRPQISAPRPSIRRVHQQRFQTHAASPARRQHAVGPASPPSQSTRAASHLSRRGRPGSTAEALRGVRLPKAVQAVFLTPLRRAPTHGIPVCDLQIRSYSVRNAEVFADLCMRAAYYLGLPARGPVPLPRITERWTVPRANFVFKKSQENFERRTTRRLVQIQDGHPETVAVWLAYVQQRRYYGVGMKANVFEHGRVERADRDLEAEGKRIERVLGESLDLFGTKRGGAAMSEGEMERALHDEPFKGAWGGYGGMGAAHSAVHVDQRLDRVRVDLEEEAARWGQAPDGASLSPADRHGQMPEESGELTPKKTRETSKETRDVPEEAQDTPKAIREW